MSKSTTQEPAGEETRDPDLGAATTEGEDGDGADSRDPGDADGTAGGKNREPAQTDTKPESAKPFDLSGAIDDVISEVDGLEAGDNDEDEDGAKDEEKTKDDEKDDAKPDDDEKPDEDKAEPEAKEEGEESPEPEAKDEDRDPDEPTADELAKMPKAHAKRISKAFDKIKAMRPAANFGKQVSSFAQKHNLEPDVLRDGLLLVADVVNAKDPDAAFDRLADEAISLVEGKRPDEMTPAEKATVLRRMANRLAPEEKPEPEAKPEEVKLPERLQDLVDTGELTLEQAKAAHQIANPPKRKETPAPAAQTKRQEKPETRAADLAHNDMRAREARGREEVSKAERELAGLHKELWGKIKPELSKALKEYKGSPPELWPKIVRDQARLIASRFAPARKKMGPSVKPSSGKSVNDRRDDLDKILDED